MFVSHNFAFRLDVIFYEQHVKRMQMQQNIINPIEPMPIKHHPIINKTNPSSIAR
jgi:hypothetical protein